MPPPEPQSRRTLSMAVASGLYSGYSPVAPGTMGSLVGLVFLLIPGFAAPWVLLSATLILFFIGISVATKHSSTVDPDPSFVVIDEVVGMWIALLFIPLTPLSIVISFLGFRLLDIVKPFPCRRLEKLPGGWGIMMDDVAAGVYANVVTRVIIEIV